MAATPNGRPVVVRDRFHLELWEKHTLELGTHACTDFAGPVSAVAMDHGGTAFLTTAVGQPTAMWRDGKLLSIPLDAPVRHVAISADTEYLFLATTDSLVMWSVCERRVVGNVGDVGQAVSFLAVADDGHCSSVTLMAPSAFGASLRTDAPPVRRKDRSGGGPVGLARWPVCNMHGARYNTAHPRCYARRAAHQTERHYSVCGASV